MEKFIKTRRFAPAKIGRILPAIVLLLSNIFLFGPFTIYQANVNDFMVPLASMLRLFLLPAVILAAMLLAVGLALPQKMYQHYVAFVFIIGVLLWLQGNILVWDYGFADGREINWSTTMWRGWIDGLVWIVLFIIAGVLYKHVYKIAILTSLLLVVLQLCYLGFISLQKPDVWKEKEIYSPSISAPDKFFEFSSKQNVIHIILDELQSTVFQEIITQNTEYYQTAMKGFTFFKETTGSFPTTIMSIPAILSGQTYNNDLPIIDFIRSINEGKTIFNVLYDNRYDVDIAVPYNFLKGGKHTNFYVIPVPYGVTKQQHEISNSDLMLNLVLFRYVPHFLKNTDFHSQSWVSFFYRNKLNKTEPLTKQSQGQDTEEQYMTKQFFAQFFAHKAFLQDIINHMSVKRSLPIYKFIHLTTPHWPIVVDDSCEYVGKVLPFTWDNIKIQAKCSLDHTMMFLEKLKKLGIYDSSFIILQGDHGCWRIPDSASQITMKNSEKRLEGYSYEDEEYFAQVLCSALPLLAIKRPYDKEGITISKAQAALTDIPATISTVLNLHKNFNFPGRSIFEIEPEKTRYREFRYYNRLPTKDEAYFVSMDKFSIQGSAFDKAAWQFSGHLMQSSLYRQEIIDIGDWNASSRFLRSGWGTPEKNLEEGSTYQWALGESATIWLSLPQDKVARLTARTRNFLNSQNITIKVDGEIMGCWSISPAWIWEEHSVIIPPKSDRPDISVVEFSFSQYTEPKEKESRPLAVLFESITLSQE